MVIPRTQLAIAGTVAIHMVIVVVMDVAQRIADDEPKRPAPRMKMIPIATAKPPPPLPDPPPEPPKLDLPPPPTTTPPKPTRRATPKQVATTPPPPASTTPPPTSAEPPPTTAPAPGGAPVVALPGVAPAARGVAVAPGKPAARTGRGGEGGTGGEGVGPGSGPPAPRVVSVASIKKMAVPKGDYDYFDAHKQYPAEARQLGVGGVIRVQLTIDDRGKVVKARLLGKGLGHGKRVTRPGTITIGQKVETTLQPHQFTAFQGPVDQAIAPLGAASQQLIQPGNPDESIGKPLLSKYFRHGFHG